MAVFRECINVPSGVSLHAVDRHLQLSPGDDRRRRRTLLNSGNQMLIDRAVPHLITRDPNEFWTAGQWMTELTGGSDVGLSETIAKPEADSKTFRLYGRKWFTSAIAQIALTLARPEGNPPAAAASRFSISKRETSTAVRATFRSTG